MDRMLEFQQHLRQVQYLTHWSHTWRFIPSFNDLHLIDLIHAGTQCMKGLKSKCQIHDMTATLHQKHCSRFRQFSTRPPVHQLDSTDHLKGSLPKQPKMALWPAVDPDSCHHAFLFHWHHLTAKPARRDERLVLGSQPNPGVASRQYHHNDWWMTVLFAIAVSAWLMTVLFPRPLRYPRFWRIVKDHSAVSTTNKVEPKLEFRRRTKFQEWTRGLERNPWGLDHHRAGTVCRFLVIWLDWCFEFPSCANNFMTWWLLQETYSGEKIHELFGLSLLGVCRAILLESPLCVVRRRYCDSVRVCDSVRKTNKLRTTTCCLPTTQSIGPFDFFIVQVQIIRPWLFFRFDSDDETSPLWWRGLCRERAFTYIGCFEIEV